MRPTLLKFGLLFLLCTRLPAAIDMQQFMAETQRVRNSDQNISVVWWMPSAYWEESFKKGKLTAEQSRQMMAVLEPYSMLVVTRMKLGAFGAVSATARSEILDALDFKFNGATLAPVPERELSQEMQNLLVMLRPLMGNMLGQFGQGLTFIVYRNEKDGKKIIDPTKPGALEAKFFNETYNWRLPLGVLLPPKFDAKTGETFPGNYDFNPFTGTKLTIKPSEPAPKKP